MRNTFSRIRESLLSLYVVMYNDKYCHYTSSCIMRNTFSRIRESLLSLYVVMYNEK